MTLSLVMMQNPEKYPGQASHGVPPDGWMCEPANGPHFVPPDHQCSCQRMATMSPDGSCAHDPDGKEHVMEDPKCAVFCHMDHCKCPVSHCEEGAS